MGELLRDTLRSLRAHALRFALTSLGILWGAFMLTYLTSTMEGVDVHFMNQLEATGPKIVMVFPGTVIKNRVGDRGARSVVLENEDAIRLASLDSVELSGPDVRLWNRVLRAGRRTKLLNVNGVSPGARTVRAFGVAEGRFITPTDVSSAARVVFLGAEARDRLFGREPVLGRRLQIESHGFRVVGVAERKGDQLVGILGRDDNAVLIPYSTAQRLFTHSETLQQIVLAPVVREASYDAIRHTRQILGLHHRFDPDVDTALGFFNIYDSVKILHAIFFGLRVFMISAGVVTLLVGAIGVMNIMLVVVGERRNEIGLRKAVGATNRSIFLQFLAEATAVCSLSGFAGAALGVGATRLVVALLPPDSPFQAVPVLDPLTVAVIVASLAGVGIVAGILPAVRAAQVDPSEALRAS